MATTYKVLGQVAPSATTASALYTVPSSTQAIVSTITVCNRGTSEGTFRVSVRVNGESLANKAYLHYDAPVYANQTVGLTFGMTLNAGDILEVYASSANFSFNAFGGEITA